jgi:DNA polymerase-3 subunit delta'
MTFTLSALPPEAIEQYLSRQKAEWNARQRALVAQLCEGAVGRARTFDLDTYTAARQQALVILGSATRGSEHSELFKVTDTYRAGAEGREKTEQLLRTLYAMLQDLLFLKSGTPELVRNRDIQGELKKMADAVDFDWIVLAAGRLSEVERGMRRNLLRSLSLDAFATALEKSS